MSEAAAPADESRTPEEARASGETTVDQPGPAGEDSDEPSKAGAADDGAQDSRDFAADSTIRWYQQRIASMQEQLGAKEQQLHDYIAAYKKAVGEMDAARARLERDKEKVIDRDRMDLVGGFLEVLDNFERSLNGIRPSTRVEDIARGLEMVRAQFGSVLQGFGVERMTSVGATFDASLHEASALVPAQGGQSDQEVVFEERAGYVYNGKLLRPARVIVASR